MTAPTGTVPVEAWSDRLGPALASSSALSGPLIVLRETASTQDVARSQATPGTVVVAARQTAGRGRFGRAWADTGTDGVAMSIVVSVARLETLAPACALAACEAIEQVCPGVALRIKWPNDLLLGGRKLAGILIESIVGGDGHRVAVIGVGVNVSQGQFSGDLQNRATSLRMHGHTVDRLFIMAALITSFGRLEQWHEARIAAGFALRDALVGSAGRFGTPQGEVAGRVLGLDPLHGLRLETGTGEVFLPAATTTVLPTD